MYTKQLLKFVSAMTFMCVIVSSMTGCVSYHKEAGVDYLMRPQPAGSVRYVTKYQVDQKKIAGDGTASVLFGVFQFSEGKFCKLNTDPHLSVFSKILEYFSPTQKAVSNAKNAALYNACESNQADQILGATFEYTIENYFFYASVKCSAKGFPARAEKIELLDKQPVILNEWQKIEYIPAPYDLPRNYSGPEDSIPKSVTK